MCKQREVRLVRASATRATCSTYLGPSGLGGDDRDGGSATLPEELIEARVLKASDSLSVRGGPSPKWSGRKRVDHPPFDK